MSRTLYWKPVTSPSGTLDMGLCDAIASRYHGCSTDWETGNEITLDAGWIPFLEGMAAAGADGADRLVSLIQTHKEVTLWVSR